jgi:hypothetical protein
MIVKHVIEATHKTGVSLILGKEYFVLSIESYGKDRLSYCILDEQGTPALYSYDLFDVIDPTLPEGWRVSIESSESVVIEPSGFFKENRNGFWENYFEGDSVSQSEAHEVLDAELKKIQEFHHS